MSSTSPPLKMTIFPSRGRTAKEIVHGDGIQEESGGP